LNQAKLLNHGKNPAGLNYKFIQPGILCCEPLNFGDYLFALIIAGDYILVIQKAGISDCFSSDYSP